jgi:hypothetical protein
MFQTDLLSIIRSLNNVFTATGICHTVMLTPASRRQHNCITNTSCCECSIKTPDDGQQVCLKHVEFFTKIKLTNSAPCWLSL